MENLLSQDQIVANFASNFSKLVADAQTVDSQILDQFRVLIGVPTLAKLPTKLKKIGAIPHFSSEILDTFIQALRENRGDKSEESYHGQRVSYIRGLFHAMVEGERSMVIEAIDGKKSLQTSYKKLQKLKTEANGNGNGSGQSGNATNGSESEEVETSEDSKSEMISLTMPKDSDPRSIAENLKVLLGEDVAIEVATCIMEAEIFPNVVNG
jgi:hypothetical protein